MENEQDMAAKMKVLATVGAEEVSKLFYNRPAEQLIAALFIMEVIKVIISKPFRGIWKEIPELLRIIANAMDIITKDLRNNPNEEGDKESNG